MNAFYSGLLTAERMVLSPDACILAVVFFLPPKSLSRGELPKKNRPGYSYHLFGLLYLHKQVLFVLKDLLKKMRNDALPNARLCWLFAQHCNDVERFYQQSGGKEICEGCCVLKCIKHIRSTKKHAKFRNSSFHSRNSRFENTFVPSLILSFSVINMSGKLHPVICCNKHWIMFLSSNKSHRLAYLASCCWAVHDSFPPSQKNTSENKKYKITIFASMHRKLIALV